MQTETELAEVGRRGRRLVWKLTYSLAAALVVIAALSISLISNVTANSASAQSQAACQLYHDGANAPVAPSTSPLGLHFSAGLRVAYYGAHCHLGPLNPVDPRVKPYLPAGVR